MKNQTQIEPIGTIIRIQDTAGVIIGYDYLTVDDKLRLFYLVVPYPEGFTSEKDIRVIRPDDCGVLASGYDTEQFRRLSCYLSGLDEAAERFSAGQIKDALNQLEVDRHA